MVAKLPIDSSHRDVSLHTLIIVPSPKKGWYANCFERKKEKSDRYSENFLEKN